MIYLNYSCLCFLDLPKMEIIERTLEEITVEEIEGIMNNYKIGENTIKIFKGNYLLLLVECHPKKIV